MKTVPPVQTLFVVVYPQGRQGNPGVLESNYTLQTAISDAGLSFVPAFTDEDLGEQWIALANLAGATTHNLSVPIGLVSFLCLLPPDGPGHIGYDPIPGKYPIFPSASVLTELRKSAAAPNELGEPIRARGWTLGPVIPYPAPAAPLEDEFDPEIREVSSVVWAKIKKAMADRKAKGDQPPSTESKAP